MGAVIAEYPREEFDSLFPISDIVLCVIHYWGNRLGVFINE